MIPKHKESPELRLSFTALALGLREMEVVVPLYLEHSKWEEVGKLVNDENLFQLTSQASSIRVFREVRQRLQTLDQETLEIFTELNLDEKRAIALIAACKKYPFIFDFIRITLKDKIQVFDQTLREEDLDVFWNTQTIEHPELEDIAETTKKKLKQVLVRLLAEAGILSSTENPWITPVSPPGRIEEVFEKEGLVYREAFLS